MASVEKTTKQIERQVVVTEDIDVFTLTLSAEEAAVLRSLTGHIIGGNSGFGYTKTRQIVDGIWSALRNAGAEAGEDPFEYTPRLKDNL